VKQCPSCGVAMGRLRALRKTPEGTPWYRYSRTRLHCPACKIELRAHSRALGYALQIVMILFMGSEVVLVNANGVGERSRVVVTGLLLACLLLTAALCGRYGFRYSAVASGDSKDPAKV
jgi:C4-type Zn-finger protein